MASVDQPDENKRFAETHGGGAFPILSDPSKETAAAYGVLHERGFALRWTFYIDADGVIQKIDKKVRPPSAGADTVANMKELGFPKKD